MNETRRMDKAGWELRIERAPSLCRHYLPMNLGHSMSAQCWCKPFLQNEAGYTIVFHNHPGAQGNYWPLASQLLK